jgi:hypothetical protein
MKIVGCDLHTRYQQIAMLDTETGELIERRLEHANGEARAFYVGLQGSVRVGIEAGCPRFASLCWTLTWEESDRRETERCEPAGRHLFNPCA